MEITETKTFFQENVEKLPLPEDGKNLRRKIDSIIRTIENLSAKKLNLEVEIKMQKKVLARKRLELKKRSKSNQVKLKTTLESAQQEEIPEDVLLLQKMDQKLLRESSRVLEE